MGRGGPACQSGGNATSRRCAGGGCRSPHLPTPGCGSPALQVTARPISSTLLLFPRGGLAGQGRLGVFPRRPGLCCLQAALGRGVQLSPLCRSSSWCWTAARCKEDTSGSGAPFAARPLGPGSLGRGVPTRLSSAHSCLREPQNRSEGAGRCLRGAGGAGRPRDSPLLPTPLWAPARCPACPPPSARPGPDWDSVLSCPDHLLYFPQK